MVYAGDLPIKIHPTNAKFCRGAPANATSLEVPMDSTSPRNPLIEWTFMTSSRMVLSGSFNYCRRRLETGPPAVIKMNPNDRFRRLVPIQRDRGAVEFQRMRCMDFIAKMLECIGSE